MNADFYDNLCSEDNQRLLIRFMLSDPNAFSRVQSILRPELFADRLRVALKFMVAFAAEYRTLPNFDQVEAETKIKLEPFQNPEQPQQQEWFFDTFEMFTRARAQEHVVLEGVDLLKAGQGAELERRMKEAMTISLVSDLGSSLMDDPVALLTRISDRSNVIPTGWDALDDRLFGGFTRGSLNIFAGASGSGKSLFLQNIALNWALAGMRVVYVTLELSEDLVNQRLMAMATGMGTREMERGKIVANAKLKTIFAGKTPPTVKKFPESTTTATDLRSYLKNFEIQNGYKPDALVVDYLDLMRPNNSRTDVSNLFVKDKFVAEELRALASELGIPLVTASQLNRSAVSAEEHDHSHIAGGISKVNTADNVMSITTSRTKREAGVYEVQLLKTRTSDGVGTKVKLGFKGESMRIANDLPESFQLPTSTPQPYMPEAEAYTPPEPANVSRKVSLDDLIARSRKMGEN